MAKITTENIMKEFMLTNPSWSKNGCTKLTNNKFVFSNKLGSSTFILGSIATETKSLIALHNNCTKYKKRVQK